MKEIEVVTNTVPAKGRSKNYQYAAVTINGVANAISAGTSGLSDTAKVAQNLSPDSTDWDKILRKDTDNVTAYVTDFQSGIKVDGAALKTIIKTDGSALSTDDSVYTSAKVDSLFTAQESQYLSKVKDDRTEHSLGIGQNLNVDGNGIFGGFIRAAAITAVGAVMAATVNANAMTASVFNGDLNGNAATATRLQTTHKLFGNDFNGTNDVNGLLTAPKGGLFYGQDAFPTTLGTYVLNYVSTTYGARVLAYDGTNYQKLSLGKLISGTTFQLELNTDGTSKFNGGVIATGIESSKGGIFYGQYASMPSGLGTYVANYVSDAYGARVLAYDGAAYKDLKIGSMPTAGVFGVTLSANGDTNIGYNIGTSNYASQTQGWRVSSLGAADFRNIYADELNVLAFTAQVSQALAGSDYLTKSVSKLSVNLTIPNAVGQTARLIVDDLEGFPGIRCFANGDYIRLRPINRNGGLIVGDAYGTVILDTSFGVNGFLNGTQAYIFTAKSMTNGAGLTVYKGAEVLDYGTSGSGLIKRTALDAAGSPYMDIATWANDPSVGSNLTTHVRLGNLSGIASCSGYGLYSDNAFLTNSILIGDLTKAGNYLSFDTTHGLQIKLGSTSVATVTDVSNSLSSANSTAQGYANTAQNAAIGAAATDATSKANNALSDSKTYTNSQITIVNGAISAKADQTTVNALGTRIDAAELKITPDAINLTVKSQTQGIANSAASAAQTNAINAAAGDATNKANSAYNNAVSYTNSQISVTNGNITAAVNSVQIGGRNLARSSKGDFTYTLPDVVNYTPPGMCFAYWVGNKSQNVVISGDVEYSNIVFTGTGSSNLAIQGAQDIGGWGEGLGFGVYDKISEGSGKFHFSSAISLPSILNNNYWSFGFRSDYITGNITFRNLMVAYGTKEMSWTPAPEDVDASIATVQSNLNSQVSILTGQISSKVSQTDFNALGTRVGTAESSITQNATNINLKVSKDGVISSINQSAESVTINASKINLVGAVTANSIVAGAVTGDKIAGNTITADKIQTNTITSLGAVTAGSFNLGNGNFIVTSSGALTATGATISGNITATSGSVGGWTISNNSLSCSGTSAKLNVNPSSSSFLNINESPDTLMHIRADGATGVNIYTQDSNGVCLHMNAQSSGSLAIDSYGSAKIISRATEGTVINGLSDAVVVVTSGGTIGTTSSYIYNSSFCPNHVLSFATGTIDMYMPYYTNIYDGQIIKVRKCGSGNINMHSNGSVFYRYADGSTTSSFTMLNYDHCTFMYCASKNYWIVN
jgi:hypothetical protein